MTQIFDPDNISSWARALRVDFDSPARARDATWMISRQVDLVDVLSESQWKLVIEENILQTVLDILTKEHIAGFDFDELADVSTAKAVQYCVEGALPYVTNLIIIVNGILKYHVRRSCPLCAEKPDTPHPQGRGCIALRKAATALARSFPSVLDALWDSTDPLLTTYANVRSRYTYMIKTHKCPIPLYCPQEFRRTLASMIVELFDNLDGVANSVTDDKVLVKDLASCLYRSARLLLVSFLHTTDLSTLEHAVITMTKSLDRALPHMENASYMTFFEDCTDGVPENLQFIAMRFVQELQRLPTAGSSERVSPPTFNALIKCALALHIKPKGHVRTAPERAFIAYSLTALRAHKCSAFIESDSESVARKRRHDNHCLADVSLPLCQIIIENSAKEDDHRPLVPEQLAHEIIPVLCGLVVSMAQDNDTGGSLMVAVGTIMAATKELCRILRYFERHPSNVESPHWVEREPAPPSMRRFSHRQWKIAEDELHSRTANPHMFVKMIFGTWSRLGRELERCQPPTYNRPEPRDFELLRRCSYSGCACSVFRVTHGMSMCKGCYLAAYCNWNCQQKDWDEHKKLCTRR